MNDQLLKIDQGLHLIKIIVTVEPLQGKELLVISDRPGEGEDNYKYFI